MESNKSKTNSKKFYILILFVIFSTICAAQSTRIGIKSGAVYSNIFGEDTGNKDDFKLGFVGGVFADIPFENEWSFQTDILYKMKGWQHKDRPDWKRKMSYLAIPLTIKFMPEDLEGVNIFLGPQFSLLLAAKAVTSDYETDVKKSYNETEVGLLSGIGYSAGIFSLELRYDYGLTTMVDPEEKQKRYNHAFSFLIGISFYNIEF